MNDSFLIYITIHINWKIPQVETIGDAYMVVSGAPEKESNHAEKVCDMAIDMVDAITGLKDPSTGIVSYSLLSHYRRWIWNAIVQNIIVCRFLNSLFSYSVFMIFFLLIVTK